MATAPRDLQTLFDPPPGARRAVFLDKDGTLVRNVPYNVDPAQVEFLPGAVEGLRALAAGGYRLVVVSNQSGVARGLFPEADLLRLAEFFRARFHDAGLALDGFYWCPHHPGGGVAGYAATCACRKPQPGLILRAAAELGIDRARSWMIGDTPDDVEAGRRAGCRTVFLRTGETPSAAGPADPPGPSASTLLRAAMLVLQADLRVGPAVGRARR